jgi:hypothetical protein
MNIGEWEEALTKANLLDTYKDVPHGFRNGFSQGIPPHDLGPGMDSYTPENHASAINVKDKIDENIAQEIKAGRMFGPYTHTQVQLHFPFFQSNPLGAGVNGDGSFRPKNDLSFPHGNLDISSVNSFVDKNNFKTTWDDFNVVSSYLRGHPGNVKLALFNRAKAYRQIPTAADQWPYLLIRDFEGNLILDTRITFGGVAGCRLFGRPADAWTKIVEHKFDLLKVFRWVDDNLFVNHDNGRNRLSL